MSRLAAGSGLVDALDGDVITRLEAAARRRFVRWHPSLWEEIIAGPGRELAEGLLAAGHGADAARPLLESYLRLASHAIGHGYLFPSEAGAQGFIDLAWHDLVPRLLPPLTPPAAALALARCWNLGESLESAPAWLRLVFSRVARDLDDLGDLDDLVARVTAQALDPPDTPLGPSATHAWIDLAAEDRRFLPGRLHLLAPTILCVHDRLRGQQPGTPTETLGVWLSDPPLVLGPTGCDETLEDRPLEASGRWAERVASDPLCGEAHAATENDWRGAASFETSQMIVVVRP